jgi:hypothetical protein
MAIARTSAFGELQVLKEDLAQISGITHVFVQTEQNSLCVLIILDEYDRKIERKIIDVESSIIEAYPWLDIDFDLVYLQGRALADVVSPKGFQLL